MEDVRYRKWVWPSINSIDPSHCAFQVLMLGSGIIVCQKKNSDTAIFKKLYDLLDATLCLYSEATLSEFSATSGSYMTLLLHTRFCCFSCFGHWEVSLNVNQVSSSLFWTYSTKCDASMKHVALLDGIWKNSCISSTIQCMSTGLSPLCSCTSHWILHHSPRKRLEVSMLKTWRNPLSDWRWWDLADIQRLNYQETMVFDSMKKMSVGELYTWLLDATILPWVPTFCCISVYTSLMIHITSGK